jgi:lysophospholipase L1-like esterase
MKTRLAAVARRSLRLHPLAVGVTIGSVVTAMAATGWIASRDRGDPTAPAASRVTKVNSRDDLIVRALGDSVTAGFGYYADGSPVPAKEILGGIKDRILAAPGKFIFGIPSEAGRCLPPIPPDGRCQSPSRVAYPAVFAKQSGIPLRAPNFENLAIAGASPLDWLGQPFADELAQIVKADPDLTVLTLGANPLLQTFLVGRAICARTPFANRCVAKEIRGQRIVSRLISILERLLLTDPGGRLGEVVVFTYHEARPIPAFGARVEALLDGLNGAIATAVAAVRSRHPQYADRLLLIDPPAFDDHQCDDDEPWVLLSDTCIHPNALGHQMFAATLSEAVADRLPPPPPPVTRVEKKKPDLLIDVAADGRVVRIGPFQPAQFLGESGSTTGVEPTVGNAISTFGSPRFRGQSYGAPGCLLRWPSFSLTGTSDDFGGGPPCGGEAGIVELSVLGGRWRTNRGLRVGDSDSRLRRLYPTAYVDPYKEHTMVLVEERSVVGTSGTIPRLSATIIDTEVASISIHIYGAGE